MPDFYRQLKKQLDHTSDVKQRIFIYYMVFFTVLSLITVLTNILSGLQFDYNYKWLIVALCTAGLFLLSVRSKEKAVIHRAGIYFLSLFVLPVCWLASSGLVSPSIIYSVLALIMINTLVSGWERVFLNLCQILLAVLLICLYYYHPALFRKMDATQQFIDWIINIPVVFWFVALLLTTFEKAYEMERLDNIRRQKKLEKLSVTDNLTGLLNRSRMSEELRNFTNIFNRTSHAYSVLMVDIDHFKIFNDTSGHLEGDKCLKAVSSILKESASRDTDRVFRYGGEEFLILLGYTDAKGAIKVGKRIQEGLKQAEILNAGTGKPVTVSIGIACISPAVREPDQIVANADDALYRAKAAGRNRIVIQPARV